ncbi:MAG: MarR family winged helix-turn-helix transcriptional regulator [Longimicrobiales bacterium]
MSNVDVVMYTLARLGERLRVRSWTPDPGVGRVTGHQLRLLRQLDDTDPVMVGELADYLGVTPSTMSLNLKRLEAAGLVTRSRDPADRRVMNVLLTRDGRAIRDAAPPLDPSRVDALLMSMRPDDRERALAGLSVLAEAATRLDADHVRYVQALAGGRET